MTKWILIPTFPGTNCDRESLLWVADNLDISVAFLDPETHGRLQPDEIAAFLIPGGFSYGDYLRAGALAARSQKMAFVRNHAKQGVPVLGICNGFQILCECGMLAGALVKNTTHRHHHLQVALRFDFDFLRLQDSRHVSAWLPQFTEAEFPFVCRALEFFSLPISCGMGNWQPPPDEAAKKDALQQAVLFYRDNENGSFQAIAALKNPQGNVLGLMPHPERASDAVLGSTQGLLFLLGLAQSQQIPIKKESALAAFAKALVRGDLYHV